MATPKVRLNVEISVETDHIMMELASESQKTKSWIIKQSIHLMKKIMDARKQGKQIIIVSRNGQQKELVDML